MLLMNPVFKPTCELIVRAIITHNNNILVNQSAPPQTGRCYYALPGGHVEEGENCMQALARELKEELAVDCQIGNLGFVIEQAYSGRNHQDGERHELVLYFEGILTSPLRPSSPDDTAVFSPEPGKRFRWLPITEIGGAPFLPSVTGGHLQKYFEGRSFPAYVFQNNITPNAG